MNTMNISELLWPLLMSLPILALGFSSSRRRWQVSQLLLAANLFIAVMAWLNSVFISQVPLASTLIHMTPLNCTVLVLISFIALIVLKYAKMNLDGDKDDDRFLRWFIAVVLSVIITVTTDNLVVFWLAWVSISLSLHQLLMFYPERPRARLAAHKKFLFARVSELLLATAFFLLYQYHQTVVIEEILLQLSSTSTLSLEQNIAAVLIAIVALIKCAQLPLHGWLIQVVESPTPVSALLHAGIINMGGFLLLLFSPLFSQSVFAQWLVLIVAGLSMVTAALIMTTRISIKVRLAWSTVAQMGLMLIECALGLYELALLHLIAHSCYKAYAFLNSGNAVNDFLRQAYAKVSLPSALNWFLAFTISSLAVMIVALLTNNITPVSPWVLVIIALASIFAFRFQHDNKLSLSEGLITGLGVLAIYTILKKCMPLLLPELNLTYSPLADAWISTLFVMLMLSNQFLQYQTQSKISRRFFIALNAGFYLDEWATRATLKIWPIDLPRTNKKKLAQPLEVIHE